MKALICKQASKYTTMGKVYMIQGEVDQTNIIRGDNGVNHYVRQDDNTSYNGGHNGIAKFSVVASDAACYLCQPAITKAQSQGLGIIAILELMQMNKAMLDNIKHALNNDLSLSFTDNFWSTVQTVVRQNDDGDRWLDIALRLADEFVSNANEL